MINVVLKYEKIHHCLHNGGADRAGDEPDGQHDAGGGAGLQLASVEREAGGVFRGFDHGSEEQRLEEEVLGIPAGLAWDRDICLRAERADVE